MEDCPHKASRLVIEYCLTYDIGTVIIGYNPQWKTECNLGKVNNQNFVFIPHARFIDKVKYKAQAYGIKVIVREESYTSKASALDFDAIPNYGVDEKSVKEKFSGNRFPAIEKSVVCNVSPTSTAHSILPERNLVTRGSKTNRGQKESFPLPRFRKQTL